MEGMAKFADALRVPARVEMGPHMSSAAAPNAASDAASDLAFLEGLVGPAFKHVVTAQVGHRE